MKAALRGCPDSRTQQKLIEAIEQRIERMAAYFGRISGVEADDLRQEAWVAVLETLPRLDMRIGNPEQHLLQRARWRILDTIRAHWRAHTVSIPEGCLEAPSFDPTETFDLIALMELLSPLQQRILRALLEGYTAREVAEILGCSPANVAYHVRRIREAYKSLEAESLAAIDTEQGQNSP
ncbi:sigma-70 family RNA polymerase sigma factor [Chthonomonas calidirosea]|uniref:sigma-70 family RNA polymerase sigma factor n=1 Tax=Chthonomonas calidirosea TaxID=454171 RepID=UPI0006EC5DA8|nr:sigma-70 family RNA polymerase sigma factor [Chthonomonas calidirosea]CEK20451.1 RNA polymerase sigma factor, sigma-70 family [Chthonomonas calidirosea]